MAYASRSFNAKQALEREIKDLYAKIGIGAPAAPTAEFATTTPVVLTHATLDDAPNGGTVTLQVAAAAANPTDTVLAAVTGTADAMVVTITPNNGLNNPDAAAEAVLNLAADITLTAADAGTGRNDDTFTVQVLPAAANPTDTVLAAVTGTEAATVITITPNNGLNNPDAAAEAVLNLTADITLTSVAAGTGRNTNTFTLEVAAAAANPTDTILAAFTGTAAAIVCTITPNDGTNNAATPVDLTTAELVELINTGAVAGKTVTVTDASSRRVLQTAAGGDATPLADAGEGDGVVGTFVDGTDIPVGLTTAELAELIDTGAVAGKTVTLTDAGSLLDAIASATGGDATALADAGEGDGIVGTYSGGTDIAVGLTTAELAELFDTGAVAGKTVTVTDAGSLLDLIASATGGDATELADAGEGDAEVATWADGADNITDESIDGCGIASIARNGVGDYSIVLQDAFAEFKSFDAIVLHATAADHTFQIKSQAVNDGTSKAIRFLCLTAGAVADPADGSKILCKIVVKNSSAAW